MGRLKQMILKVWFSLYDAHELRKIRRRYAVSIMTSEETVAYIKEHHCSIARFGDGELGLMLERGEVRFQKKSAALAEKLKDVFRYASSNVLICMPYPIQSTKGFMKHGKLFWKGWCLQQQKDIVTEIRQLMGREYLFGDSFVSRPFSGYKSKARSRRLFPLIKELWENKDVLFVEGEGTRLGIGNDLFDNTKSIKRILAPAENAFDVYPEIVKTIEAVWNGELIIMALGPTATVLAYELSVKGMQLLDVGHIDIQYEWYLEGTAYTAIKNKYVNEVKGANTVTACHDQKYLSQVVAKVGLPSEK